VRKHNIKKMGRRISILSAVAMTLLIAGCARLARAPQGTTPLPGYGKCSVQSERPGAPLPTRPGSRPSLGEEIWVVARTRSISAPHDTQIPGQGSLVIEEKGKHVPLPLKHTDVKATIEGYIATVSVMQQYQNPFDHKIEATYVFPLPENAAVNEFVMTIGTRRIRGIIRDRAEAEQIYKEAKQQGHVASLLTEERPNIFTQSVANIEPGKQIDINIRYFHTLAFDDGWHEFVFPMMVGPRFNPPGTAGVAARRRQRADVEVERALSSPPHDPSGASKQKIESHYLRPAERSGHDVSVRVDLRAGVDIEEITCPSHHVDVREHSPGHASVALRPEDHLPNKDFVLRYRVAGDRVKAGLATAHGERGGFFSLMLYPPAELRRAQRQPVEIVFVLDCSGSMSGKPIEQAKSAIRRGLDSLQPGDSFQLINFSMSAGQLGRQPLEATPLNIERARRFLANLDAEGGTMMIEGIKAALDFAHDPQRLRFVCFLTDGYIGNEPEILAAVETRLGSSRIFSFAVGSSPNRYLMDSMARMGRGAVAYLGEEDDGAAVMSAFFDRICYPALTDIAINWNDLRVSEVFPARTSDLFVGRAIMLAGRFSGDLPRQLTITGKVGGRVLNVPVQIERSEMPGRSIASVWARNKIAALTDKMISGEESLGAAIRQLALDFSLASPYTAFVAVDSTRSTSGDSKTIRQAVPVPEGVSFDKTVSNSE
jgi:Ca-activated chloride channel homolog